MMKRLLLILCALVAASSLWAQHFTAVAPDGNTYAYTITSDTVPRTVTISGANTDYQKIDIPVTVTYNANVYSVTGIGFFSYCRSLTSVIIPASVTSILGNAFGYCASLTELNYNAVYANENRYNSSSYFGENLTKLTIGTTVESLPDYFVSGNTGITSVSIPASVKRIGDNSFSNTGLTTITIPESVTSIGINAFGDCASLTELNFNAITAGIVRMMGQESSAFGRNLTKVTIGTSVENLSWFFVYGNVGLTSVTIPSSVKFIGESAFSSTGLTSIILPISINTIQPSTFTGCGSLTSITIPSSVKSIGEYAFSHTGLTSIILPSSLDSIQTGTFYNCTNLTSVNIPASMTSISPNAFKGCTGLSELNYNAVNANFVRDDEGDYDSEKTRFGSNITKLTIGSTVESLPAYFVSGNAGITSATIPSSVKSIGANAFSNTGLTAITIPTSVTSIGQDAFAGCASLSEMNYNAVNATMAVRSEYINNIRVTLSSMGTNLTKLNIGSTVESLPAYFVSGNAGITSVTIPASIKNIDPNAFKGCTGLTELNYNAVNATVKSGDVWYLGCAFGTNLTKLTIGQSVENFPIGFVAGNAKLSAVNIPMSMKNISSDAFSRCSALSSVTIPSSIKSIGSSAFSNTGLTSIVLPNLIDTIQPSTFSGCTALTSATIPSSVKSIGASAFSNSGLTIITIPSSVTSIGENAFAGCTSMTELNYNAVNATITGYSWLPVVDGVTPLTKLTIGATVESVPASFVWNIKNLPAISIPTSVKSIGASAFSNTGLTTITIPASVTSVGDYAFSSCNKLKLFIYQGSTATVGKQILIGDTALKTVKAPADVFNSISEFGVPAVSTLENITITNGALTSDGLDAIRQSYRSLKSIDMAQASNTALPDVALENCYKLEQLVLPSGLETIGYKSFAECVMLKKVNVPASVTVVGDRAFENCRRMDTLTFGSSLKASSALQIIGNWAFYNCHNLKSLIVPEGVTEIGLAAFYGCSYVEQLTLPSSLLKIGDNSFALCSSLKSITVLAEAPPVIEAQTFYDVNRAIPVLVPESTIGLYAIDTYWSEFVGIAATDPTTNPTTGLADASVRPYRISVENGELVIDNPTNLPVSVYDMQGRSVGTSVAPLLTNGLYIVKIGDFTETVQ